MRKVIGVLLMLVVVGGFVVVTKVKVDDEKEQLTIVQGMKSDGKILEVEKRIDTAYPEKPTEVVSVHNELMKILYGNTSATEEMLGDYVRTIRKLYAIDFLNLNSYDTQLEDLKNEMSTTHALQLDLVASEIKEVYVLQDENGEETKAEVNVMHTTNEGSINRTYLLVKDNEGLWKINAWQNQSDTKEEMPSAK